MNVVELRELFLRHELVPPADPEESARRAAQRPVSGFSRTLDAACLYRELCRRGLTGRKAAKAIQTLMGVHRAALLKYQSHPIQPLNEEHDRRNAMFVIAKYWGSMGRHGWNKLTPEARGLLHADVYYRLAKELPPT